MIHTDRGPGARRQYLDNVQAQVVRHGWVVQAVIGGDPGYAYTVGLTRHGHPELVLPAQNLPAVLGRHPEALLGAMKDILNHLAGLAVDGKLHQHHPCHTRDDGAYTVVDEPLPPGVEPKVANELYGRRGSVSTLTVKSHTGAETEAPTDTTSAGGDLTDADIEARLNHTLGKAGYAPAPPVDTTPDQVQGIPRDDPFLAETDEGMALRDALITATRQVHHEVSQRRDWTAMGHLHSLEAGDLVLELTRASWSKDPHTRKIGFGYLVARRGEHTYIQYGPNPDDICGWENAMFIRAEPTTEGQTDRG